MGYTISENGAKKLKTIVALVEAMRPSRTGNRLPTGPDEDSIWGYITGCSMNGLVYSFVRVVPVVTDNADFVMEGGGVLKFDIADVDSATLLSAVEVNHARGISGKVVRLTFAGYRRKGEETIPLYMFQFEKDEANGTSLPVHDHRDALNGGFAFATYHPGTALPQQNWQV